MKIFGYFKCVINKYENLEVSLIRTSNHMFGRAIWDKLPKCIFENFEIARVKRGKNTSMIHPKNWPNQTCGYRLVT